MGHAQSKGSFGAWMANSLRHQDGGVTYSDKSTKVRIVPLRDLPITVPAPARYEVALLASGAEVATDVRIAHKIDGSTVVAGLLHSGPGGDEILRRRE
jgi:hypothetical protein